MHCKGARWVKESDHSQCKLFNHIIFLFYTDQYVVSTPATQYGNKRDTWTFQTVIIDSESTTYIYCYVKKMSTVPGKPLFSRSGPLSKKKKLYFTCTGLWNYDAFALYIWGRKKKDTKKAMSDLVFFPTSHCFALLAWVEMSWCVKWTVGGCLVIWGNRRGLPGLQSTVIFSMSFQMFLPPIWNERNIMS